MSINKLIKSIRGTHLVIVVAALILGYALLNYSSTKSLISETMEDGKDKTKASGAVELSNAQSNGGGVCGNSYQPSSPLGQNSGPANASGISTSSQGLPAACAQQPIVNPSELLPKDENSEWAKLNPMGTGDLQNVNLLNAGHHIGVNTVSSSLRNANLQLRSEPANPQVTVGPWNNTTISPDANRRPLEIADE